MLTCMTFTVDTKLSCLSSLTSRTNVEDCSMFDKTPHSFVKSVFFLNTFSTCSILLFYSSVFFLNGCMGWKENI